MTHGVFYELARRRRQLALARLRRGATVWQAIPARARAPRVTRAAMLRLMAR
ncbi:hypothetical protein [Oceaniglobus indicus]|uniref:hypothetical protein n=1 Tax=Oceaniglobus indicus TaxID=2047749 RepID=UPI001304333C|nr:hypothetical protein [Oceaniglobus indicus]